MQISCCPRWRCARGVSSCTSIVLSLRTSALSLRCASAADSTFFVLISRTLHPLGREVWRSHRRRFHGCGAPQRRRAVRHRYADLDTHTHPTAHSHRPLVPRTRTLCASAPLIALTFITSDGCGWGNKARLASRFAIASFVDHVSARLATAIDLASAAALLLDGIKCVEFTKAVGRGVHVRVYGVSTSVLSVLCV